MPCRLRLALFVSLFLVAFRPPLARANSIAVGEISFITGGCNSYTCFKTWVAVGINSGGVLFDSRGFPYSLDMTGTFYIRDMSGAWGPAYGDGNINFPDYTGQVLDLSYVCTPCSAIMLKLTLNFPEELMINGQKVNPNLTLTAILLPSNGQYFVPGDNSNATIYLNYISAAPEPSSLLLMGTGLLGMAGAAKRSWCERIVRRRPSLSVRS